MVRLIGRKPIWMIVPLCLLTSMLAAAAQTLTTLANFDGANGSNPAYTSLVQGLDGNYYGTTEAGGSTNNGTIFKITPEGTLTTLYSFCSQAKCTDGAAPDAGLLLATDGNFYGTTAGGGAHQLGTVFKITAAGKLTTLYIFCSDTDCDDGSNPYAPLIQGIDGNFYGTTLSGSLAGTVFRLSPTGNLTTLHIFSGFGSDGGAPVAGLVQASNGSFYGVAAGGGQYNFGTAFEITSTGKFTSLQDFDSGATPIGALMQATDGNLYGTTAVGGNIGSGTIFRMSLEGSLTRIHSFDFTAGYLPEAALVQATDGNLYGTTLAGGILTCSGGEGCGTIFEITLDGALTTLYDFCSQTNCADGSGPSGPLLQGTNGNFYGMTWAGGNSSNCEGGCGTVFELSAGLAPILKSLPGAGKVGAEVGILGTDLKGATAVTFNGMPAMFKVRSSSLIVTHVPRGATTGKISVTLADGTLSTIAPFYVLK